MKPLWLSVSLQYSCRNDLVIHAPKLVLKQLNNISHLVMTGYSSEVIIYPTNTVLLQPQDKCTITILLILHFHFALQLLKIWRVSGDRSRLLTFARLAETRIKESLKRQVEFGFFEVILSRWNSDKDVMKLLPYHHYFQGILSPSKIWDRKQKAASNSCCTDILRKNN